MLVWPSEVLWVNPESGTVSYTYDAVGNLLTKTDNRSVKTTYCSYDALNRITCKTFSDGTPSVTCSYDTSTNGKGQLASVSNGSSTTNYAAYDPLGRVTASSQVTAGQTYPFTYGYNLAGALTTESYPTGRVLTTGYDGANRPVTLSGVEAGQTTNYITTAYYWPHGAPGVYGYGNNVWPGWSYNSRLQPATSYATVGNTYNSTLLYLNYGWGGTNNNGTLQSGSEGVGMAVPFGSLSWWSQGYTYDGMNRLSGMGDSGGYSRTFGYDAYGNMWVTGSTGLALAGNTPTLAANFRSGVDVKVDSSGMIQPGRGISVNADPAGLEKFGGARQVYSIPPELEIVQRGQNANHYEIAPRKPMTLQRFQKLLNQVKLK